MPESWGASPEGLPSPGAGGRQRAKAPSVLPFQNAIAGICGQVRAEKMPRGKVHLWCQDTCLAQVRTLKGSHGGERQRFKPVFAEVAFGNRECKFLGLMPRGPDSEGLGWVWGIFTSDRCSGWTGSRRDTSC